MFHSMKRSAVANGRPIAVAGAPRRSPHQSTSPRQAEDLGMDFKLSKEQEMLGKAVREFADKRIAPFVSQWDAEHC
jgi:hypothetical protein